MLAPLNHSSKSNHLIHDCTHTHLHTYTRYTRDWAGFLLNRETLDAILSFFFPSNNWIKPVAIPYVHTHKINQNKTKQKLITNKSCLTKFVVVSFLILVFSPFSFWCGLLLDNCWRVRVHTHTWARVPLRTGPLIAADILLRPLNRRRAEGGSNQMIVEGQPMWTSLPVYNVIKTQRVLLLLLLLRLETSQSDREEKKNSAGDNDDDDNPIIFGDILP